MGPLAGITYREDEALRSESRIEQDLLARDKCADVWWCRRAGRPGSWTVGLTGGDDLVLVVVAGHGRGVAGQRGP